VVIDARTGKIVCEGLSKPHTPRLHKGALWRLNSGTGELGVVTEIFDVEVMDLACLPCHVSRLRHNS